jgi:hypothetical protein
MTKKESVDTTDDASPSEIVRPAIAGWGLALYAGCRAIQIILEAQSMAAAVGQAVLVEWGSSRLGVAWTDPRTPTTTSAILRRVAVGGAIGIALALLVFATLVATRGAHVESAAGMELSVLVIGFATAAIHAWRDELLTHGILLRALGTSVAPVFRILGCGATSAGVALGRSDATARSVFVALLLGVVFGALWLSPGDKAGQAGVGAWRPWAAHTALRWTASTLLSGGIVQTHLAEDVWAGGSAGLLGGTAAAMTLAGAAVVALVWTVQRQKAPPSPGVG